MVTVWNIDDLKIFVRDGDLQIVDQIPFLTLECHLSARRIDTWAIKTLNIPRVNDQLNKSGGIVIMLGDNILVEGFADVVGPRSWNFEEGRDYMSFSGREDLCLVADELGWPFPTVATGGIQRSEDQRKLTDDAESVVIQLVSENVGTGRDANRSISGEPTEPWLVDMPASQNRGASVTIGTRFDPLMNKIREALEGTDLDVRVNVNSTRDGFDFEVFQYRDKTDELKFSRQLRNLRTAEWQEAIPEFNSLLISLESHDDTDGAGDTTRRRRIRGRHLQTHGLFPNTQQEWKRRVAEFMDAGDLRDDPDTEDGTEATVIQAVDDWALSQFVKATNNSWIKAELNSAARTELFEDFLLGDLVTIEPEPGTEFVERISNVKVEADTESGKLTITPSVGNVGQDLSEMQEEADQRELFNRVRKLTGT